jgi:hypothetical protein
MRDAETVTGKWSVRKLGDFSDDEHFLSLRPLTPFRSLSSLMQDILSMPQIKYESLFVLYSF